MRRLAPIVLAAAALAAVRPLVPAHAPIFTERVPVVAAGSVEWDAAYVVDARPGVVGPWPRLDERTWDADLARLVGDGAFAAPVLVIADPADRSHAVQVVARLAQDLPEARPALLLGGAGAVPSGWRWRGGGR